MVTSLPSTLILRSTHGSIASPGCTGDSPLSLSDSRCPGCTQLHDNCRGATQASAFFSFSSDCNVQPRVKINDLRNAYCLGYQNTYHIIAVDIHEAWALQLVLVMVVVMLIVFRGALLWVQSSCGEELFPVKHHQSLWQLRISFSEAIRVFLSLINPLLFSSPIPLLHTFVLWPHRVYFLFHFWPVGL